MEEEEELALLDYRTPKGQLIKLLEQKIKKPEIDDSLGKVLDEFTQLTREQATFLDNGIFQMNFAEDALLLQSCGQYYAKRVDKLWDELLQFHTHLVTDEGTTKKCTDRAQTEARKLELQKLEERLNRGKRKKISLAEPEIDVPTNGCYIIDGDYEGHDLFNVGKLLRPEKQSEKETEECVPVEALEFLEDWDDIERLRKRKERQRKRISVIVAQFQKQKVIYKHYHLPNGDEIINDINDPEEFNTREGRLISCHHIRHLFEYNDRCLLPDEELIIAKLRLAYVLKHKWLEEHDIDKEAPYDTYKEEFERYEKEFFANEKRKIQNMPQKTKEDIERFYAALRKKEKLAREAQMKLKQLGVKNLPEISFETLIVDPVKEGYQGIYDPYIPEEDEPVSEGAIEISDGDHEVELSEIFVEDQQPDSAEEPPNKPRSDSGYFDGGFEADDESEHGYNTEVSAPGTDTPFEYDKGNTENKGEQPSRPENPDEESVLDKTTDSVPMDADGEEPAASVSEGPPKTPSPGDDTALETSVTQNDETQETAAPNSTENTNATTNEQSSSSDGVVNVPSEDLERMAAEIRDFVKVGTEDENLSFSILENSYFKKTDEMIMIVYNKKGDEEESVCEDASFDLTIDLGCTVEKPKTKKVKEAVKKNKDTDQKSIKEKEDSKKRKLEENNEDNLPAKRRKLTVKQIEKLKRSLIDPVNEVKWESFFSMNYEVETGEGEISRINYESTSEDEDDDLADEDDADQDDMHHIEDQDEEGNEERSEHGGMETSMHGADETPLPLSQDSGIGLDTSTNNLSILPESTQIEGETTEDAALTSLFEVWGPNLDTALCNQDNGLTPASTVQETVGKDFTPHQKQMLEVETRVKEWKEHIMPKIKKLEAHDFDIHQYGSKIMDSMNVNETKHFSDFVSGQSSAEVVRYFISSLQLANTLNVEICGAKQGELSNDSFGLKLLSKERYHEHLIEYQAPSEESLPEKLKRIRQIQMQNKMQATQTQQKRKTTTVDEDSTRQIKPQSIKIRNKLKISSVNTWNSAPAPQNPPPRKKIKILNYSVLRSPDHQAAGEGSILQQSQNFDYQQPSTSWQADSAYQRSELGSPISTMKSPLRYRSSRFSTDSGFMPSCDEDAFLDLFNQLQETTETPLQSTPVKPKKILRISLEKNNNF